MDEIRLTVANKFILSCAVSSDFEARFGPILKGEDEKAKRAVEEEKQGLLQALQVLTNDSRFSLETSNS